MARQDTQHQGRRIRHDYGTAILSASGVASVTTTLSRLFAATAMHETGVLVSSSLTASDISNGVVTITDSAGASNAAGVINYVFHGL